MKQILLVICGAAIGGVVGYFAFFWIARQGFYALVLPGGLIGFGAGIGKTRSVLLAACCGLLAVALGFFTEWRHAPFAADESLGYFLIHVHKLMPITFIMIFVGGAVAFWVPYRRIQDNGLLEPRRQEDPKA